MTQPAHAPIPGSDPSYFRFETWQIAVIIAGMLLWPVEFAVIHTPFTFLAALAVAIFYDWRGVKNLRGFVHWDRLHNRPCCAGCSSPDLWLSIPSLSMCIPGALFVIHRLGNGHSPGHVKVPRILPSASAHLWCCSSPLASDSR